MEEPEGETVQVRFNAPGYGTIQSPPLSSAPLASAQQNPDIALAIVCAAFFVDFMLLVMVIPLLPAFSKELNLDPQYLGFVVAMKPFCEICSAPIFGWLSDVRGRKVTMVSGLFALAIATLLFGLARDFKTLLITRAFQGLASQATLNSGYALVADLYPDNVRGRKSAWCQVCISIGCCVGAPLGSTLYAIGGLQFPFFVFGGVVLITGILRMFLIDPPRNRKSQFFKPELAETSAWRRVLTDVMVWQCFLILFLSNQMSGMNSVMGPLYIALELQQSITVVGLVVFVTSTGFVFAVPIVGWIGDKWGHRWEICCFGVVFMGVFAQYYLYWKSPVYVGLTGVLLAVGDACVDATWNAALSSHALASIGSDAVGRALGLASMGRSLAHMLGPLLGSALPPHLGYGATFADAGKVLFVCGSIMLILNIVRSCRLARKRMTD